MIDHESRRQHRGPPEPEQRPQRHPASRLPHVPDDRRHRSPLPVQQQQRNAGQQYIGAALDRGRHESSPPAFETLSCHHAMLDGEHAQQHQVDHDRLADRRRDRVIYGSWHHYVADETDRIPEGNQEYQIARGPVNDRQITLHNLILLRRSVQLGRSARLAPISDSTVP